MVSVSNSEILKFSREGLGGSTNSLLSDLDDPSDIEVDESESVLSCETLSALVRSMSGRTILGNDSNGAATYMYSSKYNMTL